MEKIIFNNVSIELENNKKLVILNGNIGKIKKNFNGSDIFFINNKIFIKSLTSYRIFFKNINNYINGITNGYYIEVNFIGLGYRFLKLKNFLLLKLGYSHYIKYNIPNNIIIVGYKRKLIIYGINIYDINIFVKQLRLFKKPDIYKGKGIQIQGEIINYKIGKKK
jgi:large subunit ribosomal protein L6